MLLTFKCKVYANITMFGDVGERMLEMMGFGKRVPGAISAADVPRALQNLREALAALPEDTKADDNEEGEEPRVGLRARALPLLELLQAASAENTQVSWE